MRRVMGLVFAGGRVEDLSVLTERRAKAAVVFSGGYRTIDFALTNLANASVCHVGILTHYRPSSLMDHVGTGLAWDLVGTSRSVRFLPPYVDTKGAAFYRGPADALYQNIDYIEGHAPDDVLVVSGDHVYAMDYTPLLSFHHEHAADLTMSFVPVQESDASRFGIAELNAAGQIVNFVEKPEYPRSHLASMSVYVFRREVLIDELRRAGAGPDRTFQIHEVLHRMIPRRRAYGYMHHGYWGYTRTLDEYVAFHHDLLGDQPEINLDAWQVRSNSMARRTAPPTPTRYLPGSQVEDSLVSAGCQIQGTVRHSVLSPGVRVAAGAVVTDCVLWHDVVVEPGATLTGVVSDKRTVFGRGCEVGTGDPAPCEELPASLTCGATVVGMDVQIPPAARVGRNCVIHPEVGPAELATPIPSGKSVWAAGLEEGES